MRILHGGSNIAGIPVLLARRQRAEGHQATALLYRTVRGAAPGSVDFDSLIAGNNITRKLRRLRTLAWLTSEFDVFHFHFHTTFMRDHRDLAWFKARGKRIVFHLHGCDIRDPRRVRVEHDISACETCPIQCLTPIKLGLPEALRRYSDAIIVATPDLLEFVPGAAHVPNPVDLSPWHTLRLDAVRRDNTVSDRPLVIVHAPTDRAIKGTAHLESAVAALRAEGLKIELRLLEGLPSEALKRACLDADVAVDQVLIGWVGLFALEMMALGKPVVAYIRPDLREMQPEMPVVSADPRTLAATLRSLCYDVSRRRALSLAGPEWVACHHDLGAINARILAIYAQVGARQWPDL